MQVSCADARRGRAHLNHRRETLAREEVAANRSQQKRERHGDEEGIARPFEQIFLVVERAQHDECVSTSAYLYPASDNAVLVIAVRKSGKVKCRAGSASNRIEHSCYLRCPHQAHWQARPTRLVALRWHSAGGNLVARVRIDNNLIIPELVLADGFLYRFIGAALRILAPSSIGSIGFACVTVGLILCEGGCEGVSHLSQSIVCAPVKCV